MGDGHPDAQASHGAGLGKRLQDNEVFPTAGFGGQAPLVREINIGLIHDDDAGKPLDNGQQLFFRESVAGRIVRAAEEKDLGFIIRSSEQFFGIQGEVGFQRNLADFDVIDGRGDGIHAVTRHDGSDIVPAGLTEQPVHQVDGFVTSVAQEEVLHGDAFQFGDPRFQAGLVRVRVTVETVLEGALVRIQEDADGAGVFVAGRRVGAQGGDIGAEKFFDHDRRHFTAAAWASRPSASAMFTMVDARVSRPSRLSCCRVILRQKLSRLTPLQDRAQALVGRV